MGLRLFPGGRRRKCPSMSHYASVLIALGLCLAVPALAQHAASPPQPAKKKPRTAEKNANGPKSIGVFDDWTAATHQEAGQLVCYAFTRAQSSGPQLKNRGPVVLTVTQRSALRDSVALEAGFIYANDASVTVRADQTPLEFYAAQRNAFARDGRAAVAALGRAGRATAVSPGPRDVKVTDSFSLKGFSAALAAIGKACPPKQS